MVLASRSLIARIVLLLAVAVAGGLVALCSLVAYRQAWVLVGVLLPWGLLLALVASYSGTSAGALLAGARSGAVAFAAGWLATFVAGFSGRPEGDYLIAADWRGYALLLGGIGGVAIAVARSGSQPVADGSDQHRSTRMRK